MDLPILVRSHVDMRKDFEREFIAIRRPGWLWTGCSLRPGQPLSITGATGGLEKRMQVLTTSLQQSESLLLWAEQPSAGLQHSRACYYILTTDIACA